MKAFFIVVAVGAGIGILLPTGKPATPVAVASVAIGPARETLLERSGSGHFFVMGKVDEQMVHFVVDTGASTVALTVDDARRIGIPFSESEFTLVGRSASGDLFGKPVLLNSVSVDGKVVPHVRAVICQGLDVSLLGQSYLSRISAVQMNGDYMVLR
jgi:aspartyl protease family protein